MCQNSIEVELDKRGGKNFGPPGGKKMTIFMDDVSMPEVQSTHYCLERNGRASLARPNRSVCCASDWHHVVSHPYFVDCFVSIASTVCLILQGSRNEVSQP